MLENTTRDLPNKFYKAINMNFDKIVMRSNEPEIAKTAFRLNMLLESHTQTEPNLEAGRPNVKACFKSVIDTRVNTNGYELTL